MPVFPCEVPALRLKVTAGLEEVHTQSETKLNLKLPSLRQKLKWMSRFLTQAKATSTSNSTRTNPGIPRVMAISKDVEFLSVLRNMSLDYTWEFSENSSLNEAMNILRHEYFPIVVLDQVACERAWEACVSALVHLRRIPCVILASQYGDEYARLEMIRLGGYDVLNKSASQENISRTIEFAWFWSQYAPQPASSAAAPDRTRGSST